MEPYNIKPKSDRIPLFPLSVVLLPNMTLPLHIFEERYKVMVNECLEQLKPFGIVHYDGREVRKIGCTAKIIDVVKQYEDGRMDIVTEGEKRFVIKHIDESRIYLQASVTFFGDEHESATGDDKTLVREAMHLLKGLDKITHTKRNYHALAQLDLEHLSFLIPSIDGFTREEQQKFLEMTSPRQRIIKAGAALHQIIDRVKLNLAVQKIIGGNGNIKKLIDTS
jgi:Lon protease-like protein